MTRAVEVAPGCWVVPSEVVGLRQEVSKYVDEPLSFTTYIVMRAADDMWVELSAADVAAKLWPEERSAHLQLADHHTIKAALCRIFELGAFDGEHHKQYALDQVVRTLAGDEYDQWVAEYCAGEDGPNTYSWDEGIAP